MFGKGNVCDDEEPKERKESNGGGMRTAVVGSHRVVYELTVHLIKKKEDQIRKFQGQGSILSTAVPRHIVISPIHCIGCTALLKTLHSHFW
jgi:hypothetical protein